MDWTSYQTDKPYPSIEWRLYWSAPAMANAVIVYQYLYSQQFTVPQSLVQFNPTHVRVRSYQVYNRTGTTTMVTTSVYGGSYEILPNLVFEQNNFMSSNVSYGGVPATGQSGTTWGVTSSLYSSYNNTSTVNEAGGPTPWKKLVSNSLPGVLNLDLYNPPDWVYANTSSSPDVVNRLTLEFARFE